MSVHDFNDLHVLFGTNREYSERLVWRLAERWVRDRHDVRQQQDIQVTRNDSTPENAQVVGSGIAQ